jgi:hypothetical protein
MPLLMKSAFGCCIQTLMIIEDTPFSAAFCGEIMACDRMAAKTTFSRSIARRLVRSRFEQHEVERIVGVTFRGYQPSSLF